jgi:sugar lactone lactonase YvrE
MPKGRSGTPAFPDSAAPESPKAARVLDTVMADHGCFSCMLGGDDGRTLYIVANHYSDGGASVGVVLVHPVAVRHAGRP